MKNIEQLFSFKSICLILKDIFFFFNINYKNVYLFSCFLFSKFYKENIKNNFLFLLFPLQNFNRIKYNVVFFENKK